MRYKKALIAFILSLLGNNTFAQVWEVGLQAGGAGYMGDLNPADPLKISGLSFGGFIKANFDPNWALSLNYNSGKIKASDASSSNAQFRQRNLNFYSNLNEVSLMVDFNFLDYFSGGGFKRFSPYMYAGIGAVLFNPKTTYAGREYQLRLYTTEGQAEPYKNYALAVPFGGGVKYNMSGNWTILAHIGYRNAYTDYLDDVSGNYPDPANFSTEPSVRQMQKVLSDRSGEINGNYIGAKDTQRGDFRKRDTYLFVGIGITYTFVSQKCY